VPFALTIREGNGRGQRFRFAGDRVSIGRGAENDVVLNDAGVSRAHARIERRGAIWALLDRGSANGTQLNGAPLPAMAQLRDGDRIRVGTVAFEFRDLGERPRQPGSGARRSRLCATAWWGRQRPPARAGWIAGCALVAVAGSGTASWRFEPSSARAAREETAPRDGQPWSIRETRLRTAWSAPGTLAAARAAYDLGRRKLEERRIAPRNLYDAWNAFREGRVPRWARGSGAAARRACAADRGVRARSGAPVRQAPLQGRAVRAIWPGGQGAGGLAGGAAPFSWRRCDRLPEEGEGPSRFGAAG
jgi:hypothetical protein